MFDIASRVSYKNVASWHRDILSACGDIPVVLVSNMVDTPEVQTRAGHMSYHRQKHLAYVQISTKRDRPMSRNIEGCPCFELRRRRTLR